MGYSNPTDTPESVGRINPPDPNPLETEPPGQGDPTGVVFANDGAYWFARFATNDMFRLTPEGQFSTLGGFNGAAGPRFVAKGPNDTLWVTLENTKKVARITGVSAPAGTPTITPGAPGVLTDTRPPIVTSFGFSSTIFHRGTRLARLLAVRRRPVGTTIRWRVDEQSKTTLTFRRLLPGRRVGLRCLRPTRALRSRPRCTRFVLQRPALTYTTKPGLRRLKFYGRLSRRRYLTPGRYELTLVAADAAGNRSVPKRKRFTLLPPLRRGS
jgi:hypothetical protein